MDSVHHQRRRYRSIRYSEHTRSGIFAVMNPNLKGVKLS